MVKYKRLQVSHIWVRTLFEIVCLVVSLVVCVLLIIRSYERTFSKMNGDIAANNTEQYAHSISGLVSKDLLFANGSENDTVSGSDASGKDDARLEYIKKNLGDQLDSCFLTGESLHSGAVYRLPPNQMTPELFAQSTDYNPEISGVQEAALQAAANGYKRSGIEDNTLYTYLPLFDSSNPYTENLAEGEQAVQASQRPYAILAVTSSYRGTMEYDSLVRSRIEMIGWTGGGLIAAYYVALGVISSLRKRKSIAVDV